MGTARLIKQLSDHSAQLRFEAADALERVSRGTEARELLDYRADIISVMHETIQPGVQWHLAEIAPRLELDAETAAHVALLMERWIEQSKSTIVRSDALSCICYLAHQHDHLMPSAKLALARALKFGSSAEQARARKLIGRTGQTEA